MAWGKIFGIGVTILLLNMFIQPSLAEKNSIKTEVFEYNGNGIAGKRMVKLSMEQMSKLNNGNIEQKMKLLREYELIPQNDFIWEEKLQRFENRTSFTFIGDILHVPFLLTSFCKINAVYVISGNARIGLPITGMKKFFGSSLFSYDFFEACYGGVGVVEAKGLARTHTLVTVPGFMMNIGFIGVHIHVPMMLDIYHGYSALTFAVGFGMKSVTFNVLGFLIIGVIIGLVIASLIQSSSSNP